MKILKSLLYGLILPWLGMLALFAIVAVPLSGILFYGGTLGAFPMLVFCWVFAWIMFLMLCAAKSAAARESVQPEASAAAESHTASAQSAG